MGHIDEILAGLIVNGRQDKDELLKEFPNQKESIESLLNVWNLSNELNENGQNKPDLNRAWNNIMKSIDD